MSEPPKEPHQRALSYMSTDLVKRMSSETLEQILKGACLTPEDKANIETLDKRRDKSRKVVEIVLQKPEWAFHDFVRGLRNGPDSQTMANDLQERFTALKNGIQFSSDEDDM